jgi:hypothetical protein
MKQKTLFILIFSLLIALFGCTQQQETFIEPGKLIEYENSEMGVKIKYPENWLKIEYKNSKGEVNYIKFIASKDSFFSISATRYNPAYRTLKELTENKLSYVQLSAENTEIVESTETTLAGNPAYKIIHKSEFGMLGGVTSDLEALSFVTTMHETMIYTVKYNKVYKVGFITTPEKYKKYKKAIEEMIESFEITKEMEITEETQLTNREKEICVLSKMPEEEFLMYEELLVKKCNINEDIIYQKDEGYFGRNNRTTYYDEAGKQICQEYWKNKEETCEETLKEWNAKFNKENCNWIRICSAGGW